MSAVLSWSGGMDSTSLLLRLLREGHRVTCFSFHYGQKHKLELTRAKQNKEYLSTKGIEIDHKVIDLSSMMSLFNSALTSADQSVPHGHYTEASMRATVVPNRNAIFSALLYGYAHSVPGNTLLALGVHSGDHTIYPDCRPDFYKALFQAFALGNWGESVQLYTPYMEGDKETILMDALDSCKHLGIDFDTILKNTSTSYEVNQKGEASGRTGSDIERILAFHAIGRKDPVKYAEPWERLLDNAITLEKEAQL